MVQGSTHASGVMGGGGEEGVCIDVTPGGGSKIPHAVAMWPNKKTLKLPVLGFFNLDTLSLLCLINTWLKKVNKTRLVCPFLRVLDVFWEAR